MRITLQPATVADVPEIMELRNAASEHLTSLYGTGNWSANTTEKGALAGMRRATAFVARYRSKVIASLSLSAQKPWAIDKAYFTTIQRPLYLTSMAVDPRYQGKGVGTGCLQEAKRIAKEWPGDAIRLDAWDAAAGAGDFYLKCGYREVGRVVYRGAPLIYFELLL
jgi:GNAT superfamily N-acetyltransferase